MEIKDLTCLYKISGRDEVLAKKAFYAIDFPGQLENVHNQLCRINCWVGFGNFPFTLDKILEFEDRLKNGYQTLATFGVILTVRGLPHIINDLKKVMADMVDVLSDEEVSKTFSVLKQDMAFVAYLLDGFINNLEKFYQDFKD